ncbi:hypothetical protein HWV62_26434 [Athelia sp. TMB]|nr:hypothetical protein HWV62_26434 [Athelia sp. TMB]
MHYTAQVEELSNGRDKLLAQLADLEATIQAVQAEYNNIFNALSNISKLPNEILASIFEEAHVREPGFEMSAAQVTRRWRNVAISTSKIWAVFYLSGVNGLLGVDRAALYLTRSKSVPFDLTVKFTSGEEEFTSGEEEEFAACFGRLLAQHIHRVRLLSIDFHSTNGANILLDLLISASAPLLELFQIKCRVYRNDYRLIDILAGGAQMLAVVRLWIIPTCLPPLGSVTTLHLHIHPHYLISGQKWREALISLTNLTSLVVEGNIVQKRISESPVTLPALRSLSIRADPAQEVAEQFHEIYDTIDAPLLQSLSLHDVVDDDLLFLNNLWDLGAAKFPNLSTLILSAFNAVDSQLVPFMRAFPNVQTITFKDQSIAHFHDVLRLLGKAEKTGAYWPCLRRLASPNLRSFDRGTQDMVHSCLTCRIGMEYPIQTLALSKRVVSELLRGTTTVPSPPWINLVKVVEYKSEDELQVNHVIATR